ncbi:MAG: glycoside hydrolase family 125 protein [Limnochordia bacterium]|nr:glycoside hydrolase family 125 protein [Limnochordia bacterium]
MGKYVVTGNEYISLPTINTADGSIEGVTFLHMGAKGLIHLKGSEKAPLMRPVVLIDGQETTLENFVWERDHYWIPKFSAQAGDLRLRGTLLAPLGERGFIYRLSISSPQKAVVSLGLQGCFGDVLLEVNEPKAIKGEKYASSSGWNHAFVMEMRVGLPLFALAPMFEPEADWQYQMDEEQNVDFNIMRTVELTPGQEETVDLIWGFGYEEVAAATSAKEILRQSYDTEYAKTIAWLAERIQTVGDEKHCELLNLNMFFNFFFASGITLDTEELCLVTSRSPRYYVSAAYWDRDSLLWSFPSIVMVDTDFAREILTYVFTRQIRNVGIHSRYIDGTVLEPGFELDELCAPVLALKRYIDVSGDRTILEEGYVQRGIGRILSILATKKHATIDLYETFLQPTDDMHIHKYLTYNNMLVWRMLLDLSGLLGKHELAHQAEKVKQAIYEHFIQEHNGVPIFAWAADLEGNWYVYDEPPGSLMLMAWHGFCDAEDQVYRNTVDAIRDPSYRYSFSGKPIAEIGCEHAPHPWVLSICNSLLSGYVESALTHLSRTNLDNGVACESIHEETGECMTGEAFATCAGFLAFALSEALQGRQGDE